VLSSDDPEIVYRAAYILQQLRDGIMPDTPPEVAAELARYRAIHAEGKRSMVRRALQDGEFAAAGRFIRATGKAHLAGVLRAVRVSDLRASMAAAVLSDQEHILEMILRECAKYDRGADGYAAWLAAQNRVADGIACFEKHAPDAHAPLVYLYRAIGRTDDALKLAKDESEQLHAGLALELGDWSQASKKGRPHTQELVSYLQSGEWPDAAPDLWQLVATGQFDEALEGYLAAHQYHDAYALLLHQGRVVEALDLSEGEWTGHEYNRLLLLSRHGRSEAARAIWDKWAQNLTRADLNQQLAVIDAAASMEMDDTLKQLLNSNLVILQKPEALWSSLDDDWEHTIAAARCSRPHSTRPHRMPACTRSTRSPLTQANRNESSISKSPICCHSRTAMSAWPSARPCTRSTCHGWLRSKWNSRAPPPSLALGSTRVCCPTRPHRVPVRRLSARLPGTSRPTC